MKVAYLSVQTRDKDNDWSGEPEVSYAGFCLEAFDLFSPGNEQVVFYGRDEINELIDNLKRANLVVCFSTYCFDVLNKYYDADYPMYYDFPIFDILDMVLGELEHRVYFDTVAHSLGMKRLSNKGLSRISLWKSGKTDALKESIETDIRILKKAFEYIVTSKKWELSDPKSGDKLVLDISKWGKVAFDLSKPSFYEEVNEAIKHDVELAF